jgi:hypothetical protein
MNLYHTIYHGLDKADVNEICILCNYFFITYIFIYCGLSAMSMLRECISYTYNKLIYIHMNYFSRIFI